MIGSPATTMQWNGGLKSESAWRSKRNEQIQQSICQGIHNNTHIQERGGEEGQQEGKEENVDNMEDTKVDGGKERSVARSSVFFSCRRRGWGAEPLPLLSLGDVRMDRSCSNK